MAGQWSTTSMKTPFVRPLCSCLWLVHVRPAHAKNLPLRLTPTNSATAPAGTPVTLRAVADAEPPPTFFWLSNAIPLPGASTNFSFVVAIANHRL